MELRELDPYPYHSISLPLFVQRDHATVNGASLSLSRGIYFHLLYVGSPPLKASRFARFPSPRPRLL
ncbi:hypothetical protein OPV22_002150 [Ensete ventricosum]|uniref:Uncharacterized protein n=1 Tax=Ensete ventricosum TaxID=4639 RepID=A0AAV8RX61_ENSVE|nr:hypothetical protein OPV22_002150 [Ensete ventricosum]